MISSLCILLHSLVEYTYRVITKKQFGISLVNGIIPTYKRKMLVVAAALLVSSEPRPITGVNNYALAVLLEMFVLDKTTC